MAYAAVISLKKTLHRLLNCSGIDEQGTPHALAKLPLTSSRIHMLEMAYDALSSLQRVLGILDNSAGSGGRGGCNKRLDALEGQIRDEVYKLEDILELGFPDPILLPGGEGSLLANINIDEIDSFVTTVKKLEEEYVKQLDNPSFSEEDTSASTTDFSSKMVGLSNEFAEITKILLSRSRPDDYGVFSIVGLGGGTGRMAVAKNIFEDLYSGEELPFDCFVWVSITPNYRCKDILLNIVAQVDPGIEELLISEGEEEIIEYLRTTLINRRYMVVLDDICTVEVWDFLRSSFPEQDNGSLILLTTSDMEVAQSAESLYIYEMASLLTVDYCWDYIRAVLFGTEHVSEQLEEAGRKIAKNCRGLRLVLAKVVVFLLKTEKAPQLWQKLAADEKSSLFMVGDELPEIYKIEEDLCNMDDKILAQGIFTLATLPTLTQKMKMQMFPKRLIPKMETTSLFGMAGVGKTHLIKTVLEEQATVNHFDHFVWITLGPRYQSEEILVDILAQIYPDISNVRIKADNKLAQDLCTRLSHKKCLLVLDDVWYKEPLVHLQKLFQDIKGKTLLTTRSAEVAYFGKMHKVFPIGLLNKEESLSLFCQKVFSADFCPLKLEKAGKMIVENCEGLPLLILTVADLLSKAEKTREFWDKVAEEKNHIFREAHCKTSKLLLPSYESLNQHLKACFLYMGVFSQNYEIPTSKLIKFCISEGFLEVNTSLGIEDFAAECLSEIASRSLVMACKQGSNFRVKSYRLHSVFWHLANSEASKSKFFHALNIFSDNSLDGMKHPRRLCIRNSMLLGIREIQDSIAIISTMRSLLCVGPPHEYPVPICSGTRLLRVLDALTIRLYEFPIEVAQQIHLRYLALTCNTELPCSISNLRRLRFLIISQHLSIKPTGDSSYLPTEIWDMKGLEHLQIMGRDLPNPNDGSLLPNLSTLLDVGVQTITESVLERIPNLKRLGIRIELAPDDDGNSLHCLNCISRLQKLESLKCMVVNPELRSDIGFPPAPRTMFPSGLKKLSLSGVAYPWDYMRIIGKLPNLEVLKLKCYAFTGAEWETDSDSFGALKFLLIEDTDLVWWRLKFPSFLQLKCLRMKHCYNLEELPPSLPSLFELIEVVDCSPYAEVWTRVNEKGFRRPTGAADIHKYSVHSSWNDE